MRSTALLIITGCLLTITLPAAADQTVATGFVYNDANHNNQRDPGEAGLPDVRVSNGRDVVKTDANGTYKLPADDDTIIFVIKPRGWMTSTDKLNCPRFYYIHKPAGSPKMKFPAIEPTGPLPASIDFPLHKHDEPNRFEVLLFGDPQTRSIEEVDYLAHDIIEPLMGTSAAFAMALGDLAYDDLNMLEPIGHTFAPLGIPCYYVLGNHDRDYAAPTDQDSDDAYERCFGPSYYSFDYGPVHFVVLDSVMHYPAEGDKDARYEGGLGEEQMAFLKSDFALVPQDQLIVLTMHIPMVEFPEREALYALLAQHPHTVSFSAHYHFHHHWFLGKEDAWPGPEPHHHTTLVTTCGSWWSGAPDEVGIPHTTMRDGAPNGWCVATFDGPRCDVEFRAARQPATYQMNIYTPEAVPAAQAAETEVFVNVFAGSQRSTVEFRFDVGPWQRMEKVEREDPYYVAVKTSEESERPPNGRKLPKPIKSPHLWRGLLPADPTPGTHTIEVRTTDVYGHTYSSQRLVRIE